MDIIEKDIKDLKPYKNNPRDNKKAIEKVALSIKMFGFKVPIVIDRNDVIVTGHTRLLAAKKLGLKKVPCILADDLSEEQIKAYRIADNKVAEFSFWDDEKLSEELKNIDIDMTGFGFLSEEFEQEIAKIETKTLVPYRKIHYLVTLDVNKNDEVIDVIDKLKNMEGVEVESTLN